MAAYLSPRASWRSDADVSRRREVPEVVPTTEVQQRRERLRVSQVHPRGPLVEHGHPPTRSSHGERS